MFQKHLTAILIVVCFGLLTACNKKSDTAIPESLEKHVLEGTRTSGTGAYAEQDGYTFRALFDTNSHFQITSPGGTIEHTGTYRYRKLGKSTAELVLSANSGVRSGSELTITLKFTSPKDGAYEAKITRGESGEQTGIFKLK